MREADPRAWDGPVIEHIEQVMEYLKENMSISDDVQLLDPASEFEQEYRVVHRRIY